MILRILISYWYFRDKDLDKLFAKSFPGGPYPQVFADSGAFSAYNFGEKIDPSAYADWLHRYKHLFTTYANLDVKGDVDAGLRNLHYLEDRGLEPLPVFHASEPWGVLADLIQDYRYIALGGVAGGSARGDPLMRWLIKAFRMGEGKSVFHGFGMTQWSLITSFKWYSVDSSSWGQGFRFGAVPIFDERSGKFIKLKLGDRKAWQKNAALVRSYGYDPYEFAERSLNVRAHMAGLAALSYMKAEEWLKARWGSVTIPGPATPGGEGQKDQPDGMNFYLVDTGLKDVASAHEGLKMYLTVKSDNMKEAHEGFKMFLVAGESGTMGIPRIAKGLAERKAE